MTSRTISRANCDFRADSVSSTGLAREGVSCHSPQSPTDPDPRFIEFIEKSSALEGAKLAAAIPREYMQPSVARGFAGLAVSSSLYIGALVGIATLDRWYLVAPLVVIAGLGGWGPHCIVHDCGHGSFSRNRRLNFLIGHMALLPLLYPFHAWRHVHNWHHAHANSLELDTDWRPIPEAVYRRMPLRHRIVYVSMRTWAVWAGSIHYWVQSAFRPSFFPKKETRREVRRSICVCCRRRGHISHNAHLLHRLARTVALLRRALVCDPCLVQYHHTDAPQLRGHPVFARTVLDPQCQQVTGDDGLRVPAVAVVPHPQHLASHRTPCFACRAVLQPRARRKPR